jgi:iron(III) transport system ATP-binding protein
MTDPAPTKAESHLRVERLSKSFGSFEALRDIDLTVEESEFVCFLGPSGCGKTTLLRAIAGLDIQTRGRIFQAGREISALPPDQRDFGIVFQSYALFPNLTVRRNIAYGLENRGRKRADINARVDELLELVGLADQADKYPAQMSGGQQQRVALARALAPSPGLLLLDEPLSALDAKVRAHLRHEIKQLQRDLGVTTIMVTHDQEEALTMADRIVVMNQGVVEQIGSAERIYREPATPFVADFIGTMNFIPGRVSGPGRARVDDLELGCDVDGLAPETTVTLAIRPEDIELDAAEGIGDEHSGSNRFQARVGWIEFLGSYVRAELNGITPGRIRLSADLSAGRMRRLALSEGRTVTVVLPREHIRVYRADHG